MVGICFDYSSQILKLTFSLESNDYRRNVELVVLENDVRSPG